MLPEQWGVGQQRAQVCLIRDESCHEVQLRTLHVNRPCLRHHCLRELSENKMITWSNNKMIDLTHLSNVNGVMIFPDPAYPLAISHIYHNDVIKWIYFPHYWPFVRGIHRSPVNSPHKGQWRGALMFSLICARINGWENTGGAGDLRRHRAHYDVIVMINAKTQHSCCILVETLSLMIVESIADTLASS